MPKHKRLTMVHSAEDRSEALEGVDVDSAGNVTVGAPAAVAIVVPPPDEEETT